MTKNLCTVAHVSEQADTETRELDSATLHGCAQGDAHAQRAFVRWYQAPVFAVLSRVLGHGRDVEDLAQETFIRALRALPEFDRERSTAVSSWLFTIAVRLALDHHRRRKTSERAQAVLLHWPAGRAITPESEATSAQLRAAIVRAIAQLSIEHRAAFVMSEFHGCTLATIAEATGVPENTVKTRLFRARAVLAKALSNHKEPL